MRHCATAAIMADKLYQYKYGGNVIEYKINKGKRKHSYICISDGSVIVKVPAKATLAYAQKLLEEKAEWVIKKLTEYKKRNFTENSQIYLLGKAYKLKFEVSGEKHPRVLVRDEVLEVYCPTQDFTDNKLKAVLEEFYRKFTQEKVNDSLSRLTKQTGLVPKEITIKKLTASWGRCSSRGVISISLYLGAYPQEVIDYVVLHELCHLKHMNHSKSFWDEMKRYMPDCKQRREFLKYDITIKKQTFREL